MENLSPLKLVIGGSREGRDYRFIGDADSLRQLALTLIERLDNGKEAGPWKMNPSVIVCDKIEWERGIFSKRKEVAFLSFQLKNTPTLGSPRIGTKRNETELVAIRQILLAACGRETVLREKTVRLILKVLLSSRSREQLIGMVAHIQHSALGSVVSTPKKLAEIAADLLKIEVKS
jgi:hypothetical protein